METQATAETQSSAKNGLVKLLLAAGLFVVNYFVVSFVGVFLATATGINALYCVYGCRCAFLLIAFMLLGGKRYLRLDLHAIGQTLRLAWPVVAINAVLCLAVFGYHAYQAFTGTATQPFDLPTFLMNAGVLFLYCIMIGIDEELGLRGLAFGGLLAVLGKKRSGIMAAAIIASLIFGFLHVSSDISSITTAPQAAQALMKTLESAQFGFILCAAVLSTQNIVGAIITHCLGDWLLMACTTAFVSANAASTSYISTDASTSYTMVAVFAVQGLILLPATIKAFKKLRQLEPPQLGPFMGEQPATATISAATPAHMAA